MKKKDVQSLNNKWATRVFRAKKDLFATHSDKEAQNRDVLFVRGQKLQIWVESGIDWIKVRAIVHGQSLENTPGTTILYVIRGILEEKEEDESIIESYPVDRLKKEILQLVK